MHTHSLLLSLSLLTACASTPATAEGVSTSQRLPSLAYPNIQGGKAERAPATLSRLLLSLSTHEVLASVQLRQSYLEGEVLVKEITGRAGQPDYLVMDSDGSQYGFWIRSFQGARPELTGYLVEVRGSCAGLLGTDPAYANPVAEAVRQCRAAGAAHFDSGLRAYRVIEGQAPEDVTASIAPDPVATKATLRISDALGASPFFADDSNLDTLPVFRWIVESDPEQPLPVYNPHTFYGGHRAHAGFVVWNGENFERRNTVPASLWTCERWLDEDGTILPCPPATPEGDRFVTGNP